MAKEELKKTETPAPVAEVKVTNSESVTAGSPAKAEESVTIKKTELEELMDRIKRLEYAGEKSRLAQFDEKNKKQGLKTVKLSMIDEKVILSWPEMVKDIVEKTPNGNWYEDQKIELHFEDGSTAVLDYVVFVRRRRTLVAEVISKSIENQGTEDEQTILKVRTEDGREYTINKKFVN